jgi:hypothetical protein
MEGWVESGMLLKMEDSVGEIPDKNTDRNKNAY